MAELFSKTADDMEKREEGNEMIEKGLYWKCWPKKKERKKERKK